MRERDSFCSFPCEIAAKDDRPGTPMREACRKKLADCLSSAATIAIVGRTVILADLFHIGGGFFFSPGGLSGPLNAWV